MGEKWTDEQLEAIQASGGNVLVGAAAGSGKTAVMSERIVRMISDENSKVDAGRLLIVTFTRNAASEMKQKIKKRLAERIKNDPSNRYLRKQQLMLGRSQISTVHSFCSSLLREHFSKLDIAPDYKLVDDSYMLSLSEKAYEQTAADAYAKLSDGMTKLAGMFGKARSDAEVFDTARDIYEYRRKLARPDLWTENVKRSFAEAASGKGHRVWMDVFFEDAKRELEREKERLQKTLDQLESYEDINTKCRAVFQSDMDICLAALDLCEKKEWDGLRGYVSNAKRDRLTFPRGCDEEIKEELKKPHEKLKDVLESVKKLFSESLYEILELEKEGALAGNMLLDIADIYGDHMWQLKKERRVLEYDDLELLTLQLLYEGDGFSDLAESISACYDCIFVDEFQDTNERQKMIFDAVSHGKGNLFYVGDVKQSIYRFRNADCRIFTALRDEYENSSDEYPKYISLHKNFRSTSAVIEAVNAVFNPIMTAKAGGTDYSRGEALEKGDTGKTDPGSESAFEFHLLGCDRKELAGKTAAYIKALLDSGYPVSCDGGMRPCREEDICVLLGVAGNGTADMYEEALLGRGVNCSAANTAEFFETSEITVMMALLHIIDNPLRDVDVAAVMLSPLFGFTPDDLAKLRLECGKTALWNAVSGSGDPKCTAFTEKIRKLRNECAVLSVAETVEHVITSTDAEMLLTAPPDTEYRKAKLRAFISYAAAYAPVESRDLADFLRMCENAARGKKGPQVSLSAGEGVSITTIHKSKGLEWPIVILADASHTFNLTEDDKRYAVAGEAGLGVKIRVNENGGAYNAKNATFRAIQRMSRDDAVSEEMRVLYVALTRAKEKVAVFASVDPGKEESRFAALCANIENGKIRDDDVLDVRNFRDWLIYAYAAAGFRPADTSEPRVTRGPLTLVSEEDGDEDSVEKKTDDTYPDPDALTARINEQLAFEYKNAALTTVPAKIAVTELTEHHDSGFISRPAFSRNGGLTAAEKGTAQHRFMQVCDYEAAAEDPCAELIRIRENGIMDPESADSVDTDRVKAFFESSLGKRCLSADRVLREYAFLDSIPVTEYPGMENSGTEERMLIQGIADCILIEGDKAVLIDYKTDRVDDPEELKRRYSGQLGLYRRSLEKRLGLPVAECSIWSFHMCRQIDL